MDWQGWLDMHPEVSIATRRVEVYRARFYRLLLGGVFCVGTLAKLDAARDRLLVAYREVG